VSPAANVNTTFVRRASDAAWTGILRLANRVRHDTHHRRVAQQLKAAPRPRRVLVVCHANLCRSPYLAAVLRRNLPDIEITSAGVMGAGRRVPSPAQQAARDRGFDVSEHRSSLLSSTALERAELIIVMEPRQARMLVSAFHAPAHRVVIAGDLDSDGDEPRQIVDPWGRDPAVYAHTFSRLDRCARQLELMLPASDD
jgi:protein-tyrosine phosphatase